MKDIFWVTVICILGSLGCRSNDNSDAPLAPEAGRQIRETVESPRRYQEDRAEALYGAVLLNDLNAVKRLVEGGADVNQDVGDGFTPLHAAASSESEHAFAIVEFLVSHGADVNVKVRDDNPAGVSRVISEGCTPLHHAAGVQRFDEDLEIRSNKAVVELLLTHGAKVNEKDGYGYTPLFEAVFPGLHDVMELLIEHGADVNVRNNEDGGTVLHEAAWYGLLDTVAWLIAHGADVHARDFAGETPLHKAALGRYQDVVDCLVEHGADLHARSNRNETPQNFLDEPNDPEPIILPGSSEQVFSLIITDGLLIRQMLKSKSIDYDRLWFPAASDIDGLRRSLREWLAKEAPRIKDLHIDHDYILGHFDQYDREYAGFTKNGREYILCNMVQFPTEFASRPPRSRFFGMFDGGCAWVIVVFDARTRQVVWCRCNNM